MAPETFNETVAVEEATFVPDSVEVMVQPGETPDGEQVAVLRGRREGEVVPHFSIVLSTNTDPQNSGAAIVRMPTSAPWVSHGRVGFGRLPIAIRLPNQDRNKNTHLFFGDPERPAQLGKAVIRTYVKKPDVAAEAPRALSTPSPALPELKLAA